MINLNTQISFVPHYEGGNHTNLKWALLQRCQKDNRAVKLVWLSKRSQINLSK